MNYSLLWLLNIVGICSSAMFIIAVIAAFIFFEQLKKGNEKGIKWAKWIGIIAFALGSMVPAIYNLLYYYKGITF